MPNVPRVFKETQDQIIIQQGRGLQIVNNAATQRIIREFDTSKLKRILQSLETGLFFCQIFVFII